MMTKTKLTKPQRRILSDAVRDGKTIVYGRNGAAVLNLRDAGLVTVDWGREPNAQGFREVITVWPTDAGREAIA
jgi:hypothetical protein